MSAPDDSGFLSRWARRKAESRRGVAEPPPPTVIDPPAPPASVADTRPMLPAEPGAHTAVAAEPATAVPPPTLDDVAGLTRDSDYARFVTRDVDPGVRNAAMKKLFSDPHFNVMDGLDVYIDDYNTPDPLPHEDPDLRLQPDDAAGLELHEPADPGPVEDPAPALRGSRPSTPCCAGARPAPSSVRPRPPAPAATNCWSPARRKAACSSNSTSRPKARPACRSGRSASSTSAKPAAGRATPSRPRPRSPR
jgi:hypothetical protein